MVTFALPGEGDGAAPRNGTPRSRPPLPFAKRAYAASPFGGSAKRLGTPQAASARKLLMRDDQAPSSLTKSNLASARNIFRASTISDSPPAAPFSPSIPAATPKKVFAPGATPEPSRFRGSTVQATPRGVAAKAKDKDLFPMRIASPPKELTGETLARKVPKDWNPKGSIYADQFLADLCPPDFDDEQRRQFFCILDLRRLKYAADEIFSRKGWKLNVTNFAKEFEKSRSIILLRYGLYEFQNVKPSKEVLKRWRREHGLPEPEEEDDEDTPSKPINKKRKAIDDSGPATSFPKARKVAEKDGEEENAEPTRVPVAAPEPPKNQSKRKASVSEEPEAQPSKMSKPSAASSLFQQIANKSTASASPSPTPQPQSSTPKPNPFASAKPAGSSLAKSVLSNFKTGNATPPTNGNIFGHLSDTGSGKNSGADDEDSGESEDEATPDAAPSAEPSVAASGPTDNASQAGSSLFAPKSNFGSGFATAGSSAPGTRESTPGRSLFDRVTKDNEGQPVRAEKEADASGTPKPQDQTWNPSTTPIKFAPPKSDAKPTFGAATSTMFPPKASATSSLFGGASAKSDSEQDQSKVSSGEDKTGGESDKENDSQPAKSSLFGAKPAASQPTSGSLFSQPAATDLPKPADAPKPAANPFGAASKPTETSVSQRSTLFGAKPAEASSNDAPKPSSMFGATSSGTPSTSASSNLFAPKPTNGASGLFGGAASSTPSSNIFANASSTPSSNLFGAKPTSEAATEKPAESKPSQPTAAPAFSFGSTSSDKPNGLSQNAPKLFGAGPKSPPSSAPTTSMFEGSPMKQDEASPAKKAFTGSSNLSSAAPVFNFGSSSQTTASSNIFASSTPAANASTPAMFGAGSTSNDKPANAAVSFTSNASSGSSFSNPFASGGNGQASTPSFNFGASSTPSTGSFQFGGGSNGNAAQPGTFSFGGQSEAPKPAFGGNSAGFSFGSNSSQPPANTGTSFGSNPAPASNSFAASLQPPPGGASTTGTGKSPFPHRKIAPLKRRT